ncbi:MAG: hypothetical protein HS111_33115 [Kofleriaceae bacterium]|nr:hypothetical protein [Kofleriaceae bacterium]
MTVRGGDPRQALPTDHAERRVRFDALSDFPPRAPPSSPASAAAWRARAPVPHAELRRAARAACVLPYARGHEHVFTPASTTAPARAAAAAARRLMAALAA